MPKTESEIVLNQRLKDFWAEAIEPYDTWRKLAQENYDFYSGELQWKKEDKDYLESKGRPALTLNKLMGQVGVLTGTERQNRSDLHVFPRKGSNVNAANVFTQQIKKSLDDCQADTSLSEAFLDGLIFRKGWFGLDIDFSNDYFNGDLIVIKFDPYYVLEDPDCKVYNIDDPKRGCDYIFKVDYYTEEDLKLMYPKKWDDIESQLTNFKERDSESELGSEFLPAMKVYNADDTDYKGQNVEARLKRRAKYRVVTCFWKQFEKRIVALRTATGQVEIIKDAKAMKIVQEQQEAMPRSIVIREQLCKVLHRTRQIGEAIVETALAPYDINHYPLFRFCPYFTNGKYFGFVDNLKDPQREHNKRRSQILTLLNEGVSGAIAYEEDSLQKGGSLEIWKDDMTKAGAMLPYKKEMPQVLRKPELPVAHVTVAQMAEEDMTKIGISDLLLGQDQSKGDEPYRSKLLRQKQGILKVENIFDNWHSTKLIFGDTMLEYLTKPDPEKGETPIFSIEELKGIIDENELIDKESIQEAVKRVKPIPPQVAQMPPEQQQQAVQTQMKAISQAAMDIFISKLTNWRKGRYGVKIGEAAKSETIRMANFYTLLEMAKIYPQYITPEIVFEMSDMPEKDKIIDEIKRQRELLQRAQLQQAGSQSPDNAPASREESR